MLLNVYIPILVTVVGVIPYVNMQSKKDKRTLMKIGVILDEKMDKEGSLAFEIHPGVILDEKMDKEGSLAFAWGYFKQHYMFPNAQYHPADSIDISNNHLLITSMCEKVSEGAIMMIVDNHPNSYSSVQSYAHSLNVPTLIPGGRGSSSYDPYRFDISLLPPTIDAIVDVIDFFQWYSVVYYMFDTNDGLLRLQKLYQSFNNRPAPQSHKEGHSPTIRARRINNVTDCYEILRRIDRAGPPPKRIILDLSSRDAYNNVLQQIVDVGMNRMGYHYIIGSLGIDELNLDIFVYGGVNITGFSIIDEDFILNKKLLSASRRYTNVEKDITTDVALVIDTVNVLLKAARMIEDEQQFTNNYGGFNSNNRGRSHRSISRSGAQALNYCCNCSGDIIRPTFDGEKVLNKLKSVDVYGLTGSLEFDENGSRINYVFHVHQLQHKKPLRKVGVWTPRKGLNTTLTPLPNVERTTTLANKTFRVTTIMSEPFVQKKKNADKNGSPLVGGNNLLEGYCIDLAKAVADVSTTKFDYFVDLVMDSNYGKRFVDDGCWNGMIGELVSEDGCPNKTQKRPKADFAIAPLTISRDRQRVVDFTKPFMQTGISIMIKKPEKEKPGVFSFMYPLSGTVWLCVTIAFLGVSLVLFFVGRWSPYEWSDQDAKDGSPINNFNLSNTFWFSLGALMQQGSDTFPRSYSGRIVGSAWWFFTLILISSYTANLAAFLTIEKLTPPIRGADDLVNNPKMQYGTLDSGSSRSFFEKSRVDVYRRMWQFMKANEHRVLVPKIPMGVEKVRQGKGLYAFMLESSFNNYHNQRKPCNTMKVGDNLDNKGYGIATPKHFPLRAKCLYAFMLESSFNNYHNQRKPCNTMKVGDNLDNKGYGIATPKQFSLRGVINLAVLNLRETGELRKLEQKWWVAKGMCGTDSKDATTSALTLSNVSGIFHILVGGLIFAMIIALVEYCVQKRIRRLKRANNTQKTTPMGNRIVKKQTLEALKEVGYHERENSAFHEYPSPGTGASVAAPLVTFTDTGLYGQQPKQDH